MHFRDTVKFVQKTLGLIPEVLDAFEVVITVGKELGVIGPQMPEASHRKGTLAGQRITLMIESGMMRCLMMGSRGSSSDPECFRNKLRQQISNYLQKNYSNLNIV
jgi:hypothetical protein